MIKKQWTGNPKKKFDLNWLLAGNSGSGKTHFTGTYTGGPIHYYMADRGGEKTLEKLLINRPEKSSISIDNFSAYENPFSALWTQMQKDEKEGLFKWLAEENGLLVADSLTSLNEQAIREIMLKDHVTPTKIGQRIDHKKGMNVAHWGQLLLWMGQLVATLQELPCATVATVHLHILMDKDQKVVARYPAVNGQFRQLLAKDYDETYLLETRGDERIIHFKERLKFEAKSRSFSVKEVRNYTLDELAQAYLANKTEIDLRGKTKVK